MISLGARSTLRSAVTDQIRSWIDDGTLSSGAHLGEVELSAELEVSRATLREAMRELVQEGLLTQDNRGRVSVTSLSEADIRDLFEVRLALESAAVVRLCERVERTTAVTRLRAQLDQIDARGPVTQGVVADLRFHELLCDLTDNTALLRSWRGISGLIRMTMVSSGSASARANMTRQRHEPIVGFIERGDSEGARAYLTEHMRSALETLLAARAD